LYIDSFFELGLPKIKDDQFECVMEELEMRCWEKVQAIVKEEEGLGIEYDENVICDVCRSVSLLFQHIFSLRLNNILIHILHWVIYYFAYLLFGSTNIQFLNIFTFINKFYFSIVLLN